MGSSSLIPGVSSGSGRPKKDFDMQAALDLIERGEKIPAIATELGISAPTLRKRVAEISKKQGLLLQYRAVQSLQLTELQARILEAITPQKIDDAPLRDLVMAFKILKDKELVVEGKPSEIKGLVAHLIHLEKQDSVIKDIETDITKIEYSDSLSEEPEEEDIFSDLAKLEAEEEEQNF